ncbi:MAG: hypothetical protein JWO67_6683, partial [Streptosporangiaceae bacterium]|nr:hypothetical protein [Streptosporangiaceae bacterium]
RQLPMGQEWQGLPPVCARDRRDVVICLWRIVPFRVRTT